MKTLILGDIHGRWSQADELYDAIVEKEGVPELLIQVGDFGFWPREPKLAVWDREFEHPCLWIDGNHEDFETLGRLNLENWGFDPYHTPFRLDRWKELLKRWTYIPRGTIINGVLFIGGARSIDQMHRRRGVDWFPEENISYLQQSMIFDNIEAYGADKIHTVITHDCPGAFDVKEACIYSKVEIIDGNRKFLQAVLEVVQPTHWYFGHYHKTMQKIDENTSCEWRCIDMTRPLTKGIDYVMTDLPFEEGTLREYLR